MESSTTVEHDRLAFGEFLRQARERRRLTLEQISGETKIAPRLLTSLEQGNVQPMPKGMYRRAMLRAYAESVGLDTEAALSQFERTFEEPPPREVPLPPLPAAMPRERASERSSTPRRRTLALAGVAVAVVLVGAWMFSGDGAPDTPVQDAVTAARDAARPASVSATPPSSIPSTATALAATATTTSPAAEPATASTPVTTAGTTKSLPPVVSQSTATSGTGAPVAALRQEEASPRPQPVATEGRLVVVSDPPGARVTVNGVGWGSTPLTIRYLPFGDKRVRVTKAGYVSEEQTVRVSGERPNASLRLTLKEQP